MENTKIVELLTHVLLRLETLINKLDDNSLMSMNGIARRRAESLENYRREYERQNEHPSSPIVRPYATCQREPNVCCTGCEDPDFFRQG